MMEEDARGDGIREGDVFPAGSSVENAVGENRAESFREEEEEESRLDGDAVVPAESSVENNAGSENRAESFHDGDEADIMVEVVGSDVFVNGASSHRETEGAAVGNQDLPIADGQGELRAEASTNVTESEVELSSVGGDKSLDTTDSSDSFEMSAQDDKNVESEAEMSTEEEEGIALAAEGTTVKPESAISDTGICSENTTLTASGSSKEGRERTDSEVSMLALHRDDHHHDADYKTGHVSAEEEPVSEFETADAVVPREEENIDSRNSEKVVSEHVNGGVHELEKSDVFSGMSNGVSIEKDHHDSKFVSEGNQKPSSYVILNQCGYLSPPEKEGRFSVSDLVWGKVRSHPWWPGQIFDPADASDDAVKYYKKDSFLVAYFGDQTFAWNDSSVLKPFRSCFAEMLKQSNSDAFRNAVSCALEEVSRRVAFGLSCSCTSSRDGHSKIRTQVVKNSGIREDSSRRSSGSDKSSRASHFEPAELVRYLRGLAPRSSYGADQLDLAIARAQLSAYSLFKGDRPPTEFPLSEDWIGNDHPDSKVGKSNPPWETTDNVAASAKELFMDWEFYGDAGDDDSFAAAASELHSSSGRKRKADHHPPGGDGEADGKRLNSNSRPSFKIGECIRRVASKLTAGSSLDDAEEADLDDSQRKMSSEISAESSSVSSMLSQVALLACRPKKEEGFPQAVRTFFMGYRSSVALSRRGRKKRPSEEAAEDFEFQDVNDSYWTDRIVHNFSEEQMLSNGGGGGGHGTLEHHHQPQQQQQPVKPGRRSYTRKRFSGEASSLHHPIPAAAEEENAKRQQQRESSPAELIVKFTEASRIPSEISLNKIFRRFGGLMESETEVDHVAGRARVIFKRGFDAQVARSSCEKFNVFGATASVAGYQVGYSPLLSVKISPVVVGALPQPPPQQQQQLELAE